MARKLKLLVWMSTKSVTEGQIGLLSAMLLVTLKLVIHIWRNRLITAKLLENRKRALVLTAFTFQLRKSSQTNVKDMLLISFQEILFYLAPGQFFQG